MQYKRFHNYQRGFSHEKYGTGCEDCAGSYADPDGRFCICVACDGHSDNNCFRSAKGAEYGCEAAINILARFLELYDEEENHIELTEDVQLRLKKSIKQYWDEKVFKDVRDNPISDEEKEPLSERVRSLYEAGRGLQNIYGTTFLALAMNKDFCIALHIGDGIIMCVDKDGTYYEPLQQDAKSEMGAPASLCDTDLFSREGAFRCRVLRKIPQAAVVSSDGIIDCMDQLQFMEVFYSLVKKFESLEQKNRGCDSLDDSQQRYLESCVKHYTERGNGAEDDCSLAGMYAVDEVMPQVKIPLDMAERLWNETVHDRNAVVQDYERRKKETVNKINHQMPDDVEYHTNLTSWLEAKEKTENLKEVLRNIVRNEEDKCSHYDARLKICEEYIKRAGGMIPAAAVLVPVAAVEEQYSEKDTTYKELKSAVDDYTLKKKQKKIIEERKSDITRSYHEVVKRRDQARDTAKRIEAEDEVGKIKEELLKLLKEIKVMEYEIEKAKKLFNSIYASQPQAVESKRNKGGVGGIIKNITTWQMR